MSWFRSYQLSVYHIQEGGIPLKGNAFLNGTTRKLAVLFATLPFNGVKRGRFEYQLLSHWLDQTWNQTRVYSSRGGRSHPLVMIKFPKFSANEIDPMVNQVCIVDITFCFTETKSTQQEFYCRLKCSSICICYKLTRLIISDCQSSVAI